MSKLTKKYKIGVEAKGYMVTFEGSKFAVGTMLDAITQGMWVSSIRKSKVRLAALQKPTKCGYPNKCRAVGHKH